MEEEKVSKRCINKRFHEQHDLSGNLSLNIIIIKLIYKYLYIFYFSWL